MVNGSKRTGTGTLTGEGRIPRFAVHLSAALAFFGAAGCGNECETGDLDVMMTSSRGGTVTIAGTMTIRRDETVILISGNVVEASLSLNDVPPELLPDSATLYVVLTIEDRDPGFSEQLAVYDLENGVKGPLRGAVWSTLGEPEIEGVTFSAKPKDCGSDDRCGNKRDTQMSVKIGDGPTLSADSGYRARRGNVELGNGWSFMYEHPCKDEHAEMHFGYLLAQSR